MEQLDQTDVDKRLTGSGQPRELEAGRAHSKLLLDSID